MESFANMVRPCVKRLDPSAGDKWLRNCCTDLVAGQQRHRRGAGMVADARHSDGDKDAVAGELQRLPRPAVRATKMSSPANSPPSSSTCFSTSASPPSLVRRCVSVVCWRSGFRSSGIWKTHGVELGYSSGFVQKTMSPFFF